MALISIIAPYAAMEQPKDIILFLKQGVVYLVNVFHVIVAFGAENGVALSFFFPGSLGVDGLINRPCRGEFNK